MREQETTARNPLRLAFIVHTFDVGGLERRIAHLLNHLPRNQFSSCLICINRNGSAWDWVERRDVAVYELHKPPGNHLGIIWQLRALLRHQQIQIVHSHNWGTLVETAVAARGLQGCHHVHTEAGSVLGSDHPGNIKRWIRARLMRWALSRVVAVVVPAYETAERVVNIDLRCRNKIRIITSGIPPTVRGETERVVIRTGLGISPADWVLGSVGRLCQVKNFTMAIKAVSLLAHEGFPVHLLLVGDGPERESLQESAVAHQVASRVHLVGRQSNVARYLSAIDIYLNTSWSEGLSQALIEAAAAGLPLIVTDVGDHKAFVGTDPVCGHVIPPGDVSALATKVRQLIQDENERHYYGQMARRRYEQQYSLAKMISTYEELYKQVVSSSPVTDTNS